MFNGRAALLVVLVLGATVSASPARAGEAKLTPKAKRACALAAVASTGDPDAATSGRVARLLRDSKVKGAKKFSNAILDAKNDAGISAALQDVVSWCERRGFEPPIDVPALQASVARILESLDGFLAVPPPVPYSSDVAAFTSYLEACNSAEQVLIDEVGPLGGATVKDDDAFATVSSATQDLGTVLATCLTDAYRGAHESIQAARDEFERAIGAVAGDATP